MLLHRHNRDPYFGYINSNVLVSCPSDSECVGGLFILDFAKNSWQKVYDGDCRGVVQHNHFIYVATNSEGLLVFDDHFTLIKHREMPPLDLHGMFLFNPNILLIVETKTNSIGCYDIGKLIKIGEIRFNTSDDDENHLNDIWIEDQHLYVSMFTPYGGWRDKEENDEGCIISIDLIIIDPFRYQFIDPTQHIIISNLALPHNVQIYNDQIVFCESMELSIHIGEHNIIPFQGFTRGLAFNRDLIYVGQSWIKYPSRVTRKFSHCSIESGIYLFKPSQKISRFIPLPVHQVYQIIELDAEMTLALSNRVDLDKMDSERFFVDPDDWHDTEPFRWMSSLRSELIIAKPVDSNRLLVELNSAFPSNNYYCDVFVDNVNVGRVDFADPHEIIVEFHVDNVFFENVTVSFEVPFLWAPSRYLGTSDNRELGIAVKSVSFI